MYIGEFVKYRDYIGSIEYNPDDGICFGQLLNIDDSISYHGNNIIDLNDHYQKAVDSYIELKKRLM